jgi:hypothetical protein
VGLGSGADEVEAGDAAVEPETGYVGEVGGGDVGVEVEQDADVAAAGFVDEVVEIVEGAVGGVDGLGVGGVGLDGGEEEGVGAEGVDVVEALGDAVEAAGCRVFVGGRVEVEGVHLVDDGVLPPDVGVAAGTDTSRGGRGFGLERQGVSRLAQVRQRVRSRRIRHTHRAGYEMPREPADERRCFARRGCREQLVS